MVDTVPPSPDTTAEPEAPAAGAAAGSAAPAPKASVSSEALGAAAGLAGRTSRIVQQAASILEEELAAGIVAAREVEKRFVDVQRLRSADAQEVMQRFRRDAHDVVDILLDMVTVATNAVGGLTQRAVTIGSPKRAGDAAPAAMAGTPSLDVPYKVKAGESIELPLALENGGDAPTEALDFHSSDLVSAGGQRIEAGRVSFAPQSLVIAPRHSEVVKVTVAVPAGTPPGTYAGLLQASKLEQLRAIVTVQIE